MIGRVGEKETGTPLLNSISKMSLFRLLKSCLPIDLFCPFRIGLFTQWGNGWVPNKKIPHKDIPESDK